MVAVITAMRRQIEGDRESLLAGGEIAAIKGVRLLGRGEAGILAYRPRPGGVHGRVRAAQERRNTGGVFEVLHAFEHLAAQELREPRCVPA